MSRSVTRTYPDSPVRKRFRSISPATSRSPRRFPSSRKQSSVFYRSLKQYKGTCAKCGKEGQSIARCRYYAIADEKSAFLEKVKETKAKKAASYQNNDRTMKKTDNNKKVKFADKNPLENTNADMQH